MQLSQKQALIIAGVVVALSLVEVGVFYAGYRVGLSAAYDSPKRLMEGVARSFDPDGSKAVAAAAYAKGVEARWEFWRLPDVNDPPLKVGDAVTTIDAAVGIAKADPDNPDITLWTAFEDSEKRSLAKWEQRLPAGLIAKVRAVENENNRYSVEVAVYSEPLRLQYIKIPPRFLRRR